MAWPQASPVKGSSLWHFVYLPQGTLSLLVFFALGLYLFPNLWKLILNLIILISIALCEMFWVSLLCLLTCFLFLFDSYRPSFHPFIAQHFLSPLPSLPHGPDSLPVPALLVITAHLYQVDIRKKTASYRGRGYYLNAAYGPPAFVFVLFYHYFICSAITSLTTEEGI